MAFLPLPFRSSHRTNRRARSDLVRSQSISERTKAMMKGTGRRFPIMAMTAACHTGSPSPTPTGMAPRSSMMGSMATISVASASPAPISAM